MPASAGHMMAEFASSDNIIDTNKTNTIKSADLDMGANVLNGTLSLY